MISKLSVVDSHTAGEPTRVVTGGFPSLAGNTLHEKDASLLDQHPQLRSFLVGEPRGHAPMHAVIPTTPTAHGADAAFLILSALGSLEMCGHALIGAVTTMIEIGALPSSGAVTTLKIETLAGVMDVEANVAGGKVTSVTFTNATSWVLAHDVRVKVPDAGEITCDVAFGGLWYAIVDADELGLVIEPPAVPGLVSLSHRIRSVLNRELHGLLPPAHAPTHIPQVLFTSTASGPGANGRNLATSTELGFDRSPCGTGSSARMALLHSRGDLEVGDVFVHESVLGTRFEGRVVASKTAPSGTGIVPAITGSAYVTAYSDFVVDQADPLGDGFFVPAVGV